MVSSLSAVAFYNAVITGTLVSFGILFLKFSDFLEDDSTKISWIGTTFTVCTTVIGRLNRRKYFKLRVNNMLQGLTM